MNKLKYFFIIQLLCSVSLFAQNSNYNQDDEVNKCGLPVFKQSFESLPYSYGDLLNDLIQFSAIPYIKIDTVGKSFENRNLFLMTINDTSEIKDKNIRIWIHARTHPGEFQSSLVLYEMLQYLLSDDPDAVIMRQNCVFSILPMLNPDGVELGYGRENANSVDLESNWNSDSPEPEVLVIKRVLDSLMKSDIPINISLNLHSAYDCHRYFVCHAAAGSSEAYLDKEIKFISSIRNLWIDGFQDWDYFVSWKNSTPTQYPESWFWLNYGESVMALTYEDMNCSAAGDYDITAKSIIKGSGIYLDLIEAPFVNINQKLKDNFIIYPVPAKINQEINIQMDDEQKSILSLYNSAGTLINSCKFSGELRFSLDQSGLYLLKINSGDKVFFKKIIISDN